MDAFTDGTTGIDNGGNDFGSIDGASIENALSIDVEDYFQVWALASHFRRDGWDRQPCRVEANINRVLELLAQHRATATFFTLGWIAERHPEVVHRIVAGGHELASHGYDHHPVGEQTPGEFREDLHRTRCMLEDITGVEVRGYRAPNFSVGPDTPWALDIIAETGHTYSSSIYPVQHDHYGNPEAPRFAYRHPNGLIEVPLSTASTGFSNLPAGGGGFFRLLPYLVSKWLIRQVNNHDHQSAIFYFHPWEIDPDQPRVDGLHWKSRFRHYTNLNVMQPKLDRLLDDFQWRRVDEVFLPRFMGKG